MRRKILFALGYKDKKGRAPEAPTYALFFGWRSGNARQAHALAEKVFEAILSALKVTTGVEDKETAVKLTLRGPLCIEWVRVDMRNLGNAEREK